MQISRNCFVSLDQLFILLLANNSITSMECGMLDGMRNRQQLNLHNNSLVKVEPNTFTALTQLTTSIWHITKSKRSARTLAQQSKLFWLDISNNRLSGFEQGTFNSKIANILLDGNRLMCDESFDWFVHYLVVNLIRTFLPFQPEITCVGPEKYAGTRSLFSSFIPGLNGLQGAVGAGQLGNMANGIPVLGTLTVHCASGTFCYRCSIRSPARGERHRTADPNFVVNVPGFGDLVISKLDPNIVAHVLKGGQIPGIPKETLDGIVQQYMKKMHDAAAAARDGKLPADQAKFLPPMDKLPQEMVTSVIQGQALPGLDVEQTRTISEYYTKGIPVAGAGDTAVGRPSLSLNSDMLEMMKMLPPGYNISKIPSEILTALSKGEMPDLSNLRQDLLEHFKGNTDKMATLFSKATAANNSIEHMLSKLPKFDKPVLSTFSPYDIKKLTSDMIHEEEDKKRAAKMRIYTSIALGLVCVVTIVVMAFFVNYLRKQR